MLTPELLTDTQLEELCNYISGTVYIYYPVATNFFADMYYTGCRPSELLDQTLWNYINETLTELTPLKGNSPRSFTSTLLSANLVFAIQNNIRPYDALSYRQLKSVLYKILPVPEVTTAEKSAIDYIFRYNRVKQLSISGMSDADIAIQFGWSTSLLATSYRTQNVYSLGPLPPLTGNRIIDETANMLIDNDGTYITF